MFGYQRDASVRSHGSGDMRSLYQIWWRLLMDLRPVVRYGAERLPRLAPIAVRLRSMAHFAAGSPLQLVVSVYATTGWAVVGSFRWGFVAWVTSAVAVELVFQFVRVRGGHPALVWLVGWREAWRVRRRWPADWAIVAAKTTRVQAEVGTSKEPMASARLRPITDHPKMSWWPSVDWPVVSWWVGPPPGRSLVALDEVTALLAANISHCINVAVDFDRESDSYGRLVVTFDDPLAATIDPPVDLGSEAAIDYELDWRRLMVVPDDGWERF